MAAVNNKTKKNNLVKNIWLETVINKYSPHGCGSHGILTEQGMNLEITNGKMSEYSSSLPPGLLVKMAHKANCSAFEILCKLIPLVQIKI